MKVERGDGKAADPRGNSAKVPTSLILQFVGRRIDVCMYVSDSVYSLLRVHHEATPPRDRQHGGYETHPNRFSHLCKRSLIVSSSL